MPSGRHVKTLDELYPLLGRLIVEWSTLEFWLCQMMRGMTRMGAIQANAIFYSAVNNQTRFELLQRTIIVQLSGEDDADKHATATKLVEKARTLNKVRNRFIHAAYFPFTDGPTVMMADMGNLLHDPTHGDVTIGGQMVAWADISNHCEAVDRLSSRVTAFVTGPLGLEQP